MDTATDPHLDAEPAASCGGRTNGMTRAEREERAARLERVIGLFVKARQAGKFAGKEEAAAAIAEELEKLAELVDLEVPEELHGLPAETTGDGQAGSAPAPPEPSAEQEGEEEVSAGTAAMATANELDELSDFKHFTYRVRKGDVTPGEVRAAVSKALSLEEELKEQIASSTMDEIRRSFGLMTRSDVRKAELVGMAYNSLLEDLLPVRGFSYSPFSETFEEAAWRMAGEIDQAQIEDYAEWIEEKRAENKERREELEQAIQDPQTLEDFHTFVHVRSYEDLTDEQKARYDALRYEARLERERERERRAKERALQAPDVDAELSITEAYHEKRGIPLWVVQLSERLPKPQFNKLRRQAKEWGGWYSGYSRGRAEPGFQFESEEKAEAFAEFLRGERDAEGEIELRREKRQEKAAEHLFELAERTEERATEKLDADRKTNTRRRLRIARGVEGDAREALQKAETMQNLAEALEEGEVKFLRGVRYGTDLDTLERVLYRSKLNYIEHQLDEEGLTDQAITTKRYDRRQELKKEPISAKHVRHAEYPYPVANEHFVRALLEHTEGKKGSKRISKWWKRRLPGGRMAFDWKGRLTGKALEQFIELYEKARQEGADIKHLPGEPTHYRRLQRMNIERLPELRAALREYLEYRGEKDEPDELTEELRELKVGAETEGFFPTPDSVIRSMLDLAEIQSGHRVLEPSAGVGHIAGEIRERYDVDLTLIEIKHHLAELLEKRGYEDDLIWGDFLEQTPDEIGRFDRIVMNPPFERGQDVEHVRHAYELLKPGGRLVSVMSEGPFFRSSKKYERFRDWLFEEREGYAEPLPDDAFAGEDAFRQTGVKTRLAVIDKPGEPEEEEPKEEEPTEEEAAAERSGAEVPVEVKDVCPQELHGPLESIVRAARDIRELTDRYEPGDEHHGVMITDQLWAERLGRHALTIVRAGEDMRSIEIEGERSADCIDYAEAAAPGLRALLRAAEDVLAEHTDDEGDAPLVFDARDTEELEPLNEALANAARAMLGNIEVTDTADGGAGGRDTSTAQVTASQETEAPAGRDAPEADTSADVEELPIEELYTDEARFQPREKAYAEATVERLVENWDRRELDPLRVWKDPGNGKWYVLAGHSRLEAQRRRNAQGKPDSATLPAQPYEGSEEEAIDFALRENDKGTALTNVERAAYVRRLREEKDLTKKEIKERARDLYGRDHTTVIALSYLNPSGKAIGALRQFEGNATGEARDAETMAVWIGKLRRFHEELTDSHENEIWTWLKDNYKTQGRKITSFLEFREHVEKIISRRTFMGEFDASKPLNFQDIPEKSRQEIEIDRQLKEAREELRKDKRKLQKKREEYAGQTLSEEEWDAVLKDARRDVRASQQRVLKLEQEAQKARSQLQESERSLFDAIRENPDALSPCAIVTENEEEQGIEIRFPGDPGEDTLEILRKAGFLFYTPANGADFWAAKSTPERRAIAARLDEAGNFARENPEAFIEGGFDLGPMVYLGRALELDTTWVRFTSDADAPDFMFASADGQTLLVVPPEYVEEGTGLVDDEEAEALYERWHGFEADDQDYRIQIPDGELGRAGTAEWILYESDRLVWPGDEKGEQHTYRHAFDESERPAMRYSGAVLIHNLKINERGIVN